MTRVAALALALSLAGCGLEDPYATTSPPQGAAKTHVAPQPPRAGPAREGAPLAGARAFMRGYLPYLYGLGPARAIAAATPALRRSLSAQPRAREDGASPSQPRLEGLRALAQNDRGARVRAIVSDESRVYFAVELALVRGERGWQVATLKTNGG